MKSQGYSLSHVQHKQAAHSEWACPVFSALPWCDRRMQAEKGGKIKLKGWQRGETRGEQLLFSKN